MAVGKMAEIKGSLIHGRGGEGSDDLALAKPPNISDSRLWPNVMKPFVYGASAGILTDITYSTISLINALQHQMEANILQDKPNFFLHKNIIAIFKGMPSSLLINTICNSMRLGSYELLIRQVEAANKGMPLSLYQGVGCGFIAGVIGTWGTIPFHSAFRRVTATNATHSSVLRDLYSKAANEGILSLWKASRVCKITHSVSNITMLASYYPCYGYFRESVGLNETNSVLGAGFVSGIFASASSYSYISVHKAMVNMKPDFNGRYPCTSYLDCAFKMLKHRGPLAFFAGSAPYCFKVTLHVMILWCCFEDSKKMEQSLFWSQFKGKKEKTSIDMEEQ